ncbi:transposase [Bremerella sp. JC770]|uniref:REP-associated tyrosine transposase n=1 Tax=Bremerella sp. JC770 TaxID=3232137 RepID=UPI00345A103B
MSNYRRVKIPGATYFFTVVTEHRAPVFRDEQAVRLLGRILREAQQRWPFHVEGMVLLPEHLHAIWSLPSGDAEYSKRWGWIKKEFTKTYLRSGGREQAISSSRRNHRRSGVWHRKFWERNIRDEDELEAYLDYIHWNPVKHELVKAPGD